MTPRTEAPLSDEEFIAYCRTVWDQSRYEEVTHANANRVCAALKLSVDRLTTLQARLEEAERARTRHAEITASIVTDLCKDQYERAERMSSSQSIAPDHARAHAHMATMIDLWNRFVHPIPGLDENSLPTSRLRGTTEVKDG